MNIKISVALGYIRFARHVQVFILTRTYFWLQELVQVVMMRPFYLLLPVLYTQALHPSQGKSPQLWKRTPLFGSTRLNPCAKLSLSQMKTFGKVFDITSRTRFLRLISFLLPVRFSSPTSKWWAHRKVLCVSFHIFYVCIYRAFMKLREGDVGHLKQIHAWETWRCCA